MPAATAITNHDEIRRWVDERGGKPACVRGTGGAGDPGMLRIEFPEYHPEVEEKLAPMAWDEWLDAFERNGLALLVQDEVGGNRSYFNKLVRREHAKKEARA